ncbi:MAG: NADH-ubiquinone oxidoreductase subunit NDUFA12 family protein [Rickettsiales bacterium]|jgi:NADH:ubiquinone oxidoreductase subunit|nr:NADH-ubiquinone oxidoreductase subunit NDUFA12 family protein [Rickettsiales bacterium]
MTFSTKLFIKFFCSKIGQDQFGNSYYQTKSKTPSGKHKRLVLYKGSTEASKIPALWNAWLHYTIDEVPSNEVHCNNWEKPHIPNLTGTEYAYAPQGLKNKGKKRAIVDYQAWAP